LKSRRKTERKEFEFPSAAARYQGAFWTGFVIKQEEAKKGPSRLRFAINLQPRQLPSAAREEHPESALRH